LQIWDTAGQERFRTLIPMYYRGADCAILVYDANSMSSFEHLKDWIKEFKMNNSTPPVIAIAANKIDIKRQVVSFDVAKAYAKSIDAIIQETSAKDNVGITELFWELSRMLLQMKLREKEKIAINNSDLRKSLILTSSKKQEKSCPC